MWHPEWKRQETDGRSDPRIALTWGTLTCWMTRVPRPTTQKPSPLSAQVDGADLGSKPDPRPGMDWQPPWDGWNAAWEACHDSIRLVLRKNQITKHPADARILTILLEYGDLKSQQLLAEACTTAGTEVPPMEIERQLRRLINYRDAQTASVLHRTLASL